MLGQRGDLQRHVGIQRQSAELLVQLVVTGHIEHAVVGVLANHAPQMTPRAVALQLLRVGLFLGDKRGGVGGIEVVGDVHLHMDEEALKVRGLHYPLVIAAAFSGFSVYGIGLSGSVPLLIATEGHFLQGQMGLVPLSETIFSAPLLIATALVVLTLPLFNAWLHPKNAKDIVEIDPATVAVPFEPSLDGRQDMTLADRMNHSKVVGVVIGLLGLVYVGLHFIEGGSLDLNTVNFIFLFLGILLFASPARYLAALGEGVKIVSGIIIQYPFYAGIMGILVGSGLVVSFAELFVRISTAETLPIWSFVSGGLINILAPSGGGQWAVQGPVVIEAARELNASFAATALGVQVGDQWTNMIQPFWILPVLAISKLKLRDVMGYMVLILGYLGGIFGGTIWIWGYLSA